MKLTKEKTGIRLQGTATELTAFANAIIAKVEVESAGGVLHLEFWYEGLVIAVGLMATLNEKGALS